MEKDPLGSEILDVIYQGITNWRRFGHLLGLEVYELNNIENDYAKIVDRVEKCIRLKEESEANPIVWIYWKDILLKMDETDLVNKIEGKHAELIPDECIDMSHGDPLVPEIFYMIYQRVGNWRRFGRLMGLEEYELENIEIDYAKKEDRVERCISRKKDSEVYQINWFYMRRILLKLEETDLVNNIELEYPDLLQDKRIDISDVAHRAAEEFGILAHDASKTEHFKKIPIEFKYAIKVSAGGIEKVFQFKNMDTIQDNYFEKYKCLEKIKKYNFTSTGNFTECKILKTLHQWLEKNKDDGFCIKGYDAKQHLGFITDDYINKNPKESYILAYSKKHGCMFFVDTEPKDVNTSIRENQSNIRPIRTANPCLDDASFVFIPLTLYDPKAHKMDDKICKACIDLQLVVSSETFKALDSFEKWWEEFSNEVDKIKSELEEKTNVSNDFFKNIMTYMAFETPLLPSFTTNQENEIKEVQKLIMLTPEQQDIVYSKNRLKIIIKGSFGTGKTVVAQKILKQVVTSSQGLETTYYIMHDSDSGFVKEMEKLAIALKKENVTACKRSDLVKDTNSLSSILEYLLAKNKGKVVHVVIEEFNGEMLDKSEVEKIKILLENEEFKNSHIVIVAQSMESERCETGENIQTKSLETYQYKKLAEETDFRIFHLSYLMRSSKYINDIVNVAIPILEEAKIKSTIPNFNSGLSFNLTNPTTASNTRNFNDVSKEDKNMVQASKVTKSQKIKHGENYKEGSKVKNSDIIKSYDDTCKILKQFTINSDKYSSKREIESMYTFVGERETAHNVKGKQPVIYYPFKKETKDFAHQIFCLSEVLKVILNDKKEQVIICLNIDSMNMVKGALKVNKANWTNDPQLLTTDVCLLSDYTAVRGCEFENVILIYPTGEHHLKQNLVGGINRCKFDLSLVVLYLGIPDDALIAILHAWTNAGLVNVSNEDYIKNADNMKLKRFKEINHDILNSRYQNPNMDINDPKVIQKLKSFGRSLSDNQQITSISSVNSIDSKPVASTSTFQEMSMCVLPETPRGSKCYDNWELQKPNSVDESEAELHYQIVHFNFYKEYTKKELRWIPLDEEQHEFNHFSIERERYVRERIDSKKTLNPILLASDETDAGRNYNLGVGMHERSVLLEYGYTHILASVEVTVSGEEPFIEEEIIGDREKILKYTLMNDALIGLGGVRGINFGNVYVDTSYHKYDENVTRREYRESLFTKRHIKYFAFGEGGAMTNYVEVTNMVNEDVFQQLDTRFKVRLQMDDKTWELTETEYKLAEDLQTLIAENNHFFDCYDSDLDIELCNKE